MAALKLAPLSMDLIIDDGEHKPVANELTLLAFWPYLKPGGFFIIEDVVSGGDAKGQFMGDPASWSAPGRARLTHEQQWLKPETIALLRRADSFLADTTVGHRDWEGLKRSIPGKWCRNRVDHNTHAMVIRKREARKAVQNRPKRLESLFLRKEHPADDSVEDDV